MYNFVFDIPTRVLFGAGQLNNLEKEKFPGKKAIIVISNGSSAKKYGYLKDLKMSFKKQVLNILFLMKSEQIRQPKMS